MTKIVVAEVAVSPQRNIDIERDILGAGTDVCHYIHDGNDNNLVAACQDAGVILTDYVPLSRSVIQQLEKCQLISVAATGYDCVDVAAAADAGISVCAVDEYCTDEVADHTILLMLALCRRLAEYHAQVQYDLLWEYDSLSGLRRLSDMTLGIVGFGRIGQAVAKRAQGFGLTLLVHDPFMAKSDHPNVTHCDLQTLCRESDIVSLHCALSADNRHLIDGDMLRQMRKQPILINCSRGGLVDEQALIAALDTGQISAAGLDVLNDEAPDLVSSPLRGRENVILTPHVAFYSDASMLENRRVSASNIRNFLDGKHEFVRQYIHHATK